MFPRNPRGAGALLAVLSGCSSGLVCGKGTIEQDGECVAVDQGDDDGTTPTGGTQPATGLAATPPELDLGPLLFPCAGEATVVVANTGPQALALTGISVAGDGALSLVDPPAPPVELAPGATLTLTVRAEADAVGTFTGALTLTADAPAGSLLVPLAAEVALDARSATFTVGSPAVDLLLAIDHSCSMEEDNQVEVELGLPALVDALDATVDWRMIEITHESGCANGGILSSSTPNAGQLLVEHAWDAAPLSADYLTEALLELAGLALAQTDVGGCNEGSSGPASRCT
jgi:hypothetical protein